MADGDALTDVLDLSGNGKGVALNVFPYFGNPLVFSSLAAFPNPGSTRNIYIADDTEKAYRWAGSPVNAYVEISPGVASTPDPIVPADGTQNITGALSVSGNISAGGSVSGSNLSGVNTGDQTIQLTGDVTGSGTGSFAATIGDNVVTYAKMQNISATARFIGRITAGAGDPEELTGAQATSLLDAFTAGLKGLAPASGGGTTNFLRADGTWAAPPGGGLSDGDKGDVVVSGGGTVLTVESTNDDLEVKGDLVNITGTPAGIAEIRHSATAGGRMRIQNAGGSFGAVWLDLINEVGANGAIFTNNGLDLVDFKFQGVTAGVNAQMRLEGRAGIPYSGDVQEFEWFHNGTVAAWLGSATGFYVYGRLGTQNRLGLFGDVAGPGAITASGYAWHNNAQGLQLQGEGTTNDFNVLNKSGNSVIQLPTGTLSPAFQKSIILAPTTAPGAPTDGELWYDSGLGKFRKRQGGVTTDLDTVGGGGLSDGDYGDIIVSGVGTAMTIDADVVSFAKMQNIATDRLIGRDTAASGDPEEISVSGGLEFSGSGAIQRSALTGDVTAAAGSNSTALTTNHKTRTITFIIDGGGSAITTGVKGFLEIPFACTITGWTILADQSGSIVVDVWKDTYANFPPTVADTIAGTEKPTLSSVQKNQDLSLSTWTTAITAGDILAFNVDSITTVTRVTISIRVTVSA